MVEVNFFTKHYQDNVCKSRKCKGLVLAWLLYISVCKSPANYTGTDYRLGQWVWTFESIFERRYNSTVSAA